MAKEDGNHDSRMEWLPWRAASLKHDRLGKSPYSAVNREEQEKVHTGGHSSPHNSHPRNAGCNFRHAAVPCRPSLVQWGQGLFQEEVFA